MARKRKYHSYDVTMGEWSYRTRAPDATTAKRNAAKWYKPRKAPKRSISSLMKAMKAKRAKK